MTEVVTTFVHDRMGERNGLVNCLVWQFQWTRIHRLEPHAAGGELEDWVVVCILMTSDND